MVTFRIIQVNLKSLQQITQILEETILHFTLHLTIIFGQTH